MELPKVTDKEVLHWVACFQRAVEMAEEEKYARERQKLLETVEHVHHIMKQFAYAKRLVNG